MKTLNLLIDELISRIEALGNQINLSLDSLSAIKKFIQQLRDSINQLEENNANTTSQLSRKLLRLADKLKEEKRQYTLSINQLKGAVISLEENTEKIIKSYEENSEYFRQKMEETERQVEESGGNLANSLISWGRKIKDIQQELEEFKEAVESQAETAIERGRNWEKTLMATPASLRETLKEFTRQLAKRWKTVERENKNPQNNP